MFNDFINDKYICFAKIILTILFILYFWHIHMVWISMIYLFFAYVCIHTIRDKRVGMHACKWVGLPRA
jgi:hypothetical protein